MSKKSSIVYLLYKNIQDFLDIQLRFQCSWLVRTARKVKKNNGLILTREWIWYSNFTKRMNNNAQDTLFPLSFLLSWEGLILPVSDRTVLIVTGVTRRSFNKLPTLLHTVCPRSLDSFHIVNNYIILGKTSWTYSTKILFVVMVLLLDGCPFDLTLVWLKLG